MARASVKRVAARLGVLEHLYATRVALLNARAQLRERGLTVAEDGLPLPPPHLRTLVAGDPDRARFVENGIKAEAAIREAVGATERPFETLESILDFGCGCGRTLRRWASVEVHVHGTDVNPELVDWCQGNLTFASFSVNGPVPPLALPAATFDLIYAISVFTHLPEDAQQQWIGELARVLAPEGILVITTHGASHASQLPQAQREAFERGELVVNYPNAAGSNLCAAYHPASYVRDHLATNLRVAAHLRECIDRQDVHVLRPR